MPHTFEQEKELLTLLVTLIGGQVATVVVAAIHAWLSHQRYKATKNGHDRIETELKELNGKHKGDE